MFTPLKNTLFGNVSVGGELVTTGGWQTRVLRVAGLPTMAEFGKGEATKGMGELQRRHPMETNCQRI